MAIPNIHEGDRVCILLSDMHYATVVKVWPKGAVISEEDFLKYTEINKERLNIFDSAQAMYAAWRTGKYLIVGQIAILKDNGKHDLLPDICFDNENPYYIAEIL